MDNPYEIPAAPVIDVVTRERYSDRLDDVAYGQKNVIYAILLYFGATALAQVFGLVAGIALIICFGLSVSGIYKIGRGLKYPLWVRLLLLAGMLVPLLGLVILLVLNNRATARLKQAGFSVGLLGARRY